MQFSKIFPKEKKRKRSPLKGISSGELSIKIKKALISILFGVWLTPHLGIYSQLLWGIVQAIKWMAHLRKFTCDSFLIWLSKKNNNSSEIYSLVHQGAGWNKSGLSYNAASHLCLQVCAALDSPHALYDQHQQPSLHPPAAASPPFFSGGFCSAHLYLICKRVKTPRLPKCGILPSLIGSTVLCLGSGEW